MELKIKTHDEIVLAQGKRSFFGNSLNTCSYWVDGVLIDTGPRSLGRQYEAFFQTKPVALAALTHSHEDHAGNAAFLARQGIPVYVHAARVEAMGHKAPIALYRHLFWRARPPFSARPLPDTLTTVGGQPLAVIATPGHTDDHLAFLYPEKGMLFTGDLFVSPHTRMGAAGENYHQWMNSLAQLLEYDFATVCCGHSGFVKDGKKLLAKKLEKLRELEGKILALGEKGMNAAAIDRELFPAARAIKFISGGEWASIHIVRSLLGGN